MVQKIFLPNFAKISEPLVKLTKKFARFTWNPECQVAFEYLKESLTCVPLLAYPDVNKPFTLYTDASDTCVGAVLVQSDDTDTNKSNNECTNNPCEKPIYFLSHRLSPTQTRYSTTEKEAFAIHYALNKLHYYLHNSKFVIKTDHHALKYLFNSEIKNRRIQAWSLTIGSYNCTIEYLQGKDNVIADLLSRSPPPMDDKEVADIPDISDKAFQVSAINTNLINPSEFVQVEAESIIDKEKSELPSIQEFDLQEEQSKDKDIVMIKDKLESGKADPSVYKKYLVVDNIVYYISKVDDEPTLRLYVPEHLKTHVIDQYHHKNGHMAVVKTFNTIKEKYFWPNLYKELYAAIDKCVTCKIRNLQTQKAPIQETGIPPFPFASIGIDMTGPYKTSLSGNQYLVTIIDKYSGWVEAFPVPDKSATTIVEILLEQIIPRHSCVLSITSDNAREFCGEVFTKTLNELNILHIKTSPHHPEGNARVERSHRVLHDMIAKQLDENVDTWDLHLGSVLLAINTHVSMTTGMSPFFLLYNREPLLPLDNLLKPRRKYEGEEYYKIALEQQHKAFIELIRNTKKSRFNQNERANRNRKPNEFKVGDHVYYKNHNKSNKLENNWKTQFIIIEQKGPVSFVIKKTIDR